MDTDTNLEQPVKEVETQDNSKLSAVEQHVIATGEFPPDHPSLKLLGNFSVGDKVSILVDSPTGKPVEGEIVEITKVPGELIKVKLDNGWIINTIPENILKV